MARMRRPGTALTSRNTFRNSQKVSPLNLPISRAEEKLAVPQTHGSKVTDALARRMMVHNRILGFRRNPPAAARSLLLKVHFVQSPQVHRTVRHQFAEF